MKAILHIYILICWYKTAFNHKLFYHYHRHLSHHVSIVFFYVIHTEFVSALEQCRQMFYMELNLDSLLEDCIQNGKEKIHLKRLGMFIRPCDCCQVNIEWCSAENLFSKKL